MYDHQPFPLRHQQLQKISLKAGDVSAYAVLLAPKRGKRESQALMILKNSVFKSRTVKSTPPRAEKLREMWRNEKKLVACEGVLELRENVVVENPSLAACAVEGCSRDGWDAWKLNGMSLDKAWNNDPSIILYDRHSQFPVKFKVPGEVIRVPSPPAKTTSYDFCTLGVTEDFTKERIRCHYLARGNSHDLELEAGTYLYFQRGTADVQWASQIRRLSQGEMIALPSAERYRVQAQNEDICFLQVAPVS